MRPPWEQLTQSDLYMSPELFIFCQSYWLLICYRVLNTYIFGEDLVDNPTQPVLTRYSFLFVIGYLCSG